MVAVAPAARGEIRYRSGSPRPHPLCPRTSVDRVPGLVMDGPGGSVAHQEMMFASTSASKTTMVVHDTGTIRGVRWVRGKTLANVPRWGPDGGFNLASGCGGRSSTDPFRVNPTPGVPSGNASNVDGRGGANGTGSTDLVGPGRTYRSTGDSPKDGRCASWTGVEWAKCSYRGPRVASGPGCLSSGGVSSWTAGGGGVRARRHECIRTDFLKAQLAG